MAKMNISDKIFAFVPITTQTILGSYVKGKANFMALGWLTRCNFKPPMIQRKERGHILNFKYSKLLFNF